MSLYCVLLDVQLMTNKVRCNKFQMTFMQKFQNRKGIVYKTTYNVVTEAPTGPVTKWLAVADPGSSRREGEGQP